MSKPHIVVIGAGPGGLAAARQLAASGAVDVTLVEREGVARFLPGILPVVLGLRPADGYRRAVALPGVRVRSGDAVALEPGRLRLADGATLDADAVVAAPGLVTDAAALPAGSRTLPIWELEHARAAAPAMRSLDAGRLVVAIAGLPYRCPPAPYGLAMALAGMMRERGARVEVTLTTPEPRPLATLGERVSAFIEELANAAGVQLAMGFQLDLAASRDGLLVSEDGRRVACDLALAIPPHRRPALLAGLPGSGPLVQVDARQRTAMDRAWVVGDVAATPLPRAAGVAEAQGRTAAQDVLAALGVGQAPPPHQPEPSCYVWTAPSRAARIQIRFPHGMPPAGAPDITLDPPSAELFAEALDAGARWADGLAGA